MKTLIIYCSEYKGNTEKIARFIGGKIGSDVINGRDFHGICTADYDLLGFGSGVYKESLSPKLIRIVDKIV